MVKNNKIPIIIAVIKFDNVIYLIMLAHHSIVKGNTATKNIIIEEKYHNNEYLIGILPFLKTPVVIIDNITSEKHIADVRINNLTLEFQHSSITENEKTTRENFYKNMFWIVEARK